MNTTHIKVRGYSIPEGVSVTIKEDGIIVSCTHDGSHPEMLFSLHDDDSHSGIVRSVCDACGMQQLEDGEWVE